MPYLTSVTLTDFKMLQRRSLLQNKGGEQGTVQVSSRKYNIYLPLLCKNVRVCQPTQKAMLRYKKNSIYRTCGMTLLEVVLAIAVAGFIMTAAVSLLVSISSIWSDRSERYFFADHVDGTTEYLAAAFATASTEIASGNLGDNQSVTEADETQENVNSETVQTENGSLISNTGEPIRWERPVGFANYQEPLLNFSMKSTPPILVNMENKPLIGINVFLHFEENEGLTLLWHSIFQEEIRSINDLNCTLISPLVKKIIYIYWDERFERWEEEGSPQKSDKDDQYTVPRFIKLIFEYKGETKERILAIPAPSRSALIF